MQLHACEPFCLVEEAKPSLREHLAVVVQARPSSELCMVRLLKELALHAATLKELPQLLGSCLDCSQEALQLVRPCLDFFFQLFTYYSLLIIN